MIRDHVRRPPPLAGSTLRAVGPRTERPCEFMNCRRPRAEHARSVSGRHLRVGVQ